MHVVWEVKLGRSGLGGIAATEKYVVIGDRDLDDFQDAFRCYDAKTGGPVWTVQSLAIGKLDYGNSPRATPLIDGERVFLFGAFGDLHCVELETGKVVWHKNVRSEFAATAELPWGYCGSPLLVDGKLIVNPGAEDASLVALDPAEGSTIWKTPGAPPSYGSLAVGKFGGKQQLVGHDADSLGGWDVETGERLWKLTPEAPGDFNVPTPLEYEGKLLVTTENNGTRLYRFEEGGEIDPDPVMSTRRLAPDMSSPVIVGDRLFCVNRFLYCLDLADDLQEVWRARDRALADYGSIVADDERLLIIGKGALFLVDANGAGLETSERLQVFDEPLEIYSYPALVGNRLYIRGESSLKCIVLP